MNMNLGGGGVTISRHYTCCEASVVPHLLGVFISAAGCSSFQALLPLLETIGPLVAYCCALHALLSLLSPIA